MAVADHPISAWCACSRLVFLSLILTSSGCVGPPSITLTRLRYDQAVHRTSEEQWLRNIVRLRYGEMPTYLDITAITSQFELSGNGNMTVGQERASENRSLFGNLGMQFRDAPTLSYTPRPEAELTRAILAPVGITALGLMANSGWSTESVVRLIVAEANGEANAPGADQLVPATVPLNNPFEHVANVLGRLRASGAGFLITVDDPHPVSAPISSSMVHGSDLVSAADKKLIFRRSDHNDPSALVLTKSDQINALVIRSDHLQDPEVQEIRASLHLNSNQANYRVRRVEHSTVDPLDPILEAEEEIAVRTRTILEMMIFLSKGVEVPEKHCERRLAVQTPGPDGCPFDWTQVTRRMFRVHAQKKRPKNAAVAIQYRGYWYYVDEADHVSRSTLTLIHALMNVQLTEPSKAGPLLTLPVGL